MAGRIRSIKPEILDDEECATLSDAAWRLWVSSWCLADDYGNLRAGDRYLAALVWQDTTRSPRVAENLRELQRARRLLVYEVRGERYAHVLNWSRHQRVDNAGKPRVPSPENEESITWAQSRGESPRAAASGGDSPLDLRPPTSDLRPIARPPAERAPDSPALIATTTRPRFDLDALYAAYPRKEGKAKGMAKLRSLVDSDAAYQRHQSAIANLRARITRDGIELAYVPHFSTWTAGKWLDYADGVPAPAAASARSAVPEPQHRPDSLRRLRDATPPPDDDSEVA